MKKATNLIGLAAAGLIVAGCAETAGTYQNPHMGFTTKTNARLQNAYGNLDQRLQDLSVAFRATAPDTVTFAFDSSRLNAGARRALDQQAAWLMANEGVRMTVVGHTDLVGGEGYNQRLGLRRARRTVNYLVAKGVSRSRLDAVESRGESEPVVATEEREERNRRTVTMVAGFDRLYVGDGLDGFIAQGIYQRYRDNLIAGGYAVQEVDSEN